MLIAETRWREREIWTENDTRRMKCELFLFRIELAPLRREERCSIHRSSIMMDIRDDSRDHIHRHSLDTVLNGCSSHRTFLMTIFALSHFNEHSSRAPLFVLFDQIELLSLYLLRTSRSHQEQRRTNDFTSRTFSRRISLDLICCSSSMLM